MKPIELSIELELIRHALPENIEMQDLSPQGHQVYALPLYGQDGRPTPDQYVSYLKEIKKGQGEKYWFYGLEFSMSGSPEALRKKFSDAVLAFQEKINGSR